jgi:rhodanese-related sulfurtransferase
MDQLIDFIMRHPYLWGGVAIITFLLILLEFEAKLRGIRRLTAAEVSLLINRDGIVVDLNENDGFAQGHILGSLHLPFSANMQSLPSNLDKQKASFIVVTASHERQAMQAANILKKAGFSRVGVLSGGLPAWRNANLPLVK